MAALCIIDHVGNSMVSYEPCAKRPSLYTWQAISITKLAVFDELLI